VHPEERERFDELTVEVIEQSGVQSDEDWRPGSLAPSDD
jgi:hypothetical protein